MKSLIQLKTYAFSLEIVKMRKSLVQQRNEFILSKQLIRSGTSIGANVEEALGGYSKKDFRAKLGIAYKEARETKYWLRLLKDSGYISQKTFQPIFDQCEEICKILYKILESSK